MRPVVTLGRLVHVQCAQQPCLAVVVAGTRAARRGGHTVGCCLVAQHTVRQQRHVRVAVVAAHVAQPLFGIHVGVGDADAALVCRHAALRTAAQAPLGVQPAAQYTLADFGHGRGRRRRPPGLQRRGVRRSGARRVLDVDGHQHTEPALLAAVLLRGFALRVGDEHTRGLGGVLAPKLPTVHTQHASRPVDKAAVPERLGGHVAERTVQLGRRVRVVDLVELVGAQDGARGRHVAQRFGVGRRAAPAVGACPRLCAPPFAELVAG